MKVRSILIAAAMTVTLTPVTAGVAGAPAESAAAAAEDRSHIIRMAPPCFEEDGAGQTLCVWDAKKRGNRKGTSLIWTNIGPDSVVPIRHRKAARMVKRWRQSKCVKVTRRDYVCRGWNRG